MYRLSKNDKKGKESTDNFLRLLLDPVGNTFQRVHDPLLFNGHMQTLYASIYADYIAQPRVTFKREFLTTIDGGIVSLDWTDEPEPIASNPDVAGRQKTPYVFILHGLTGGSHETYVQDLIIEVKKYGYKAIVMNFRGCSNTPVQSAQLYSGSFTGDVQMCLKHIQTRDPTAVLFGCGFSLGSSVLTKYCGQMGENCPLVGMVSVGNPYDFLGSLRALHRSFIGRNLYSYHMGRNLTKVLFKHEEAFRNCEWLDFQEVAAAKSIMEFDAAATSKGFGYKTVHEYYRFGSSAQDIPYVSIPALFLTAQDDPISNCEVIPYYEIQANPNAILATTSKGGHLGWFKWNWSMVPKERWFQTPVAEFVHAILESHLSLPPGVVAKKKTPLTGTPWHSLPVDALNAREELLRLSQKLHVEKKDKDAQTDQMKDQLEVSVPESLQRQESSIQTSPTTKKESEVQTAKSRTIWDFLRGDIRFSKINLLFLLLGFLLRRK
jgi:predicted alpha/beta-fold hydrolase